MIVSVDHDDPKRTRDLRLGRMLVSLISLTFVLLGLMAIVTEYYYGRTTKLGGAEVTLYGNQAVVAGTCMMVFGLSPLALWAKTPKMAGVWASGCIIVSFAIWLLS